METKSYFAYENYMKLLAAVGQQVKEGAAEAAEDGGFIEDHFKNFIAYVSAVCNSEVGIAYASESMTGDVMRSRITELDKMRSANHNAAISSASAINRIAAYYGVGPIFTGDATVRVQVAEFCMEATRALFENRRM